MYNCILELYAFVFLKLVIFLNVFVQVKAVLEGGISSYKESGFPTASYDRINLVSLCA